MNVAAEGPTDEAVIRRLLGDFGVAPQRVVLHGKQTLMKRLVAYNRAAQFSPWLCVVDLDRDPRCPPHFIIEHLPERSRLMFLRVAVRTIEAWLLADRTRCASFLHIGPELVPVHPEQLINPKQVMVNMARRSRSRQIAADMVPREGSGSSEGPAYASRLQEFALGPWRPEIAAQSAPSLERCLRAIRAHIEEREAG